MKKRMMRLALIALSLMLVLAQAALAEAPDRLQAVYDALTAEGSDFSQAKDLYSQYYEGVSLEAEKTDNAIVITLRSENEYVESGAWTFALEGDYLTATLQAEDYYGAGMAQLILGAAVNAQDVNTSLFYGYLSALTLTGQESKYFYAEENEADGSMKIHVQVAGPYEMEGLDAMVLTEDILKENGFEPVGENSVSRAINFGKVSLIANSTDDTARFLVMEYGSLDELGLQAAVNAARVLQPRGWEAFAAACTEWKDMAEADFSVVVNADEAAVKEIIEDPSEGYSFAIISFGQ